jgi:predicted HTH transcriptional regulator
MSIVCPDSGAVKFVRLCLAKNKWVFLMTYFPFPEAALREALLNAIVHKDYASGVPIQISVYDDRIIRRDAPQGAAEWVIDKVTDRVTEKELVVLKVIAGNPHITIAKLVNTLSVSRKTVSKHIKTLKAQGIIKRVGSDRKGFWEVT